MSAENDAGPIETLRRAAALMRERAKAAKSGPWWVHDANPHDVWWGDQAAVRAVDQDSAAERPLLLGAATLALWWYYATTTGQIMLAVIPSVSIVWGWLMRAAMNAKLGKP